jgi:hypothetical protein
MRRLLLALLLSSLAYGDDCTPWYVETADGVNNICYDGHGNTWLHNDEGVTTFPGDTVSNQLKEAIAAEEGRTLPEPEAPSAPEESEE